MKDAQGTAGQVAGRSGGAVWDTVPARAEQVFGAAVDAAALYVRLLCTVGVERGLVGPHEPNHVWNRHVLGGAAVGELLDATLRVADVGSGAGLPGIPLALARPDLTVTLIEPMQRRVAFLEMVVEQLRIPNVQVTRGRAQEVSVDVQVVVARAVAPLPRLLPLTLPLLSGGGTLLAVKGATASSELAAATNVLEMAQARATVKTVGEDADKTTVVVIQIPPQGRSGRLAGTAETKRTNRGAR